MAEQKPKPAGNPPAPPPPQRPQNTSSTEPNDGPRTTHPPAGEAVKTDPDGSGRAVYPPDRPELYGGRPTDADGRRDRG